MLNELLAIQRGARQANINMTQRHPDIKKAGRKRTLIVQLDKKGRVVSVKPLSLNITPWTLRDGQHNSFPFVQTNEPLWQLTGGDAWREEFLRNKDNQKEKLFSISKQAQSNIDNWPNKGLLQGLRERGQQLAGIKGTEAELVRITIARFLRSCRHVDTKKNLLLQEVIDGLIQSLNQNAQEDWIKIAVALLVGKKQKNKWICNGALLFEAEGFDLAIADPKLISFVSQSLKNFQRDNIQNLRNGDCGLTGEHGQLAVRFHQPNLPQIGQTFLFSKNDQTPANDRYGRFASESMPVIQETTNCLDAVIRTLTSDVRKNQTWCIVPGEAPKQNDLLLAFVEHAPDVMICESLAEEDFSEDDPSESSSPGTNSVAAFEKRTERLVDLVKAKVGNDITKTSVQLVIFRKVDQANRKAVYAGTLTVSGLYQAAKDWKDGEKNVPEWLTLSVLLKGNTKPESVSPPHVAPLGLIAFSKQIFLRNGERPGGKKKEQIGLPASEVLRFFIDGCTHKDSMTRSRAERILRLLLARRFFLLEKVACVQHIPQCCDQRSDLMKKLDRYEALRTLTVIGILLHTFNRKREVYMNETAFKLGQLLAGADMVHAGYCADVRGGDIPPTLLGNQVFAMAQNTPVKALSVLCQRWKPYDGWAKKVTREASRIEELVSSGSKDQQNRGWDIRNAVSCARRIRPLASALAPELHNCRVDDIFRAELLLGYVAGFPKVEKGSSNIQDNN